MSPRLRNLYRGLIRITSLVGEDASAPSFRSEGAMRLLLLEPDRHLAERLQESLESEGYVVDIVETPADARHSTAEGDVPAIATESPGSAPSPATADQATVLDVRATTASPLELDIEIWFG